MQRFAKYEGGDECAFQGIGLIRGKGSRGQDMLGIYLRKYAAVHVDQTARAKN